VTREGGIPRRAVEEGPARGELQEGLEEGLPAADAEPRIKELAPRWIPPRGDWKLGVWAYSSERGVVITRVARGSAAEREGLEPGDRIVNVGGYQVGYVGDWLYPLGYELQRQAGRRGQVLLLVQNVRGKELVNLRVQLDPGGSPRPFPRERE
jgi:S1-C subfamily serine protease